MRYKKGSCSKGQIQKIHALASVLGLIDAKDKSGYYEMLGFWGYKTSKDLSFNDAGEIISRLEKDAVEIGIWKKIKSKNSTKFNEFDDRKNKATPAELRAIEGLWNDISYSPDKPKALRQFIHNKFCVSAIEWIDSTTAKKVIETLKTMKKTKNKGGKK